MMFQHIQRKERRKRKVEKEREKNNFVALPTNN